MTETEPQPFEAKPISQSTHVLVRWIFLRGLGVVYLIAFASVFVQVLGLIGSTGILPAHAYLEQTAPSLGELPFLFSPTVFWLNSSDFALRLVPALGAICALMVSVGVATGPCLIICWLLYLSLVTVGGDFLSFQWDVLLLEVGFLSIFFSHFKLFDFPRGERKLPAPSAAVLWLLRFLLFKLMLSSGLVKLLSGDVAWHDFTALHITIGHNRCRHQLDGLPRNFLTGSRNFRLVARSLSSLWCRFLYSCQKCFAISPPRLQCFCK